MHTERNVNVTMTFQVTGPNYEEYCGIELDFIQNLEALGIDIEIKEAEF